MGALTGLQSLDLKDHYRSAEDDLVSQFYRPCLTVAQSYDRAVGYFTSGSLSLAVQGINSFVRHAGRMRLIASPYLNEVDVEQLTLGYDYRAIINGAILRTLDGAEDDAAALAKLGTLGRLVADGVLDVKLAIVRRGDRVGLYHEKIGIFQDASGDQVAFNGSANETARALIDNFESVELFRSWLSEDRKRVARIASQFTELWEGRTANLEILNFPDIATNRLMALSRSTSATGEIDDDALRSLVKVGEVGARPFVLPHMPTDLKLRGYQKDAIKAWFQAQGRGTFQMATGTGKTITALTAMTKLAEVTDRQGQPLVAVVVAPQLHLVDQWLREAQAFGIRGVPCYGSSGDWTGPATAALQGLAARGNGFMLLATTNASLARPPMQDLLSRTPGALLIIGDEAHNLGARQMLQALPERAAYRLALSATPDRWFDDEGTGKLLEYFGEVLIDLDLGEAIKRGALCEYDYYPILISLEDEEGDYYSYLSEQIARLLSSGEQPERVAGEESSELSDLLRRRAALLGHCRAKLPALTAELSARRTEPWQLVYCAEGRHPKGDPQAPRQIDAVMRILGRDLQVPCHPYTAQESRPERTTILSRFASQQLRALVSMRCLDEGVDVPQARTAYMLASSTNPRQFVQRRGRVLRRASDKEFATILDFVVVPGQGGNPKHDRGLLAREVARFAEFAMHARNAGSALDILRPLRDTYGLMDI